MRRKFILLTFMFILQTSFAQITYGEINKREAIRFKAPKPYDSLNDFHKRSISKLDLAEVDLITNYELKDSLSKRLEFNDYKKYIGLDFFLPKYIKDKTYSFGFIIKNYKKIIDKSNNEIYTNNYYKISNVNEIFDNYYKVVDVKNRIEIENKIVAEFKNLKAKGYKTSYETPGEMYNGNDILFTLVKKNSTDTIYMQSKAIDENFTLVPYFVKMKELYDGKKMIAINDKKYHNLIEEIDVTTSKRIVIPHLSKWVCEINLLKDSENNNKPKFIFKNELGQTIVLNNWCRSNRNNGYEDGYKHLDDLYFITELEYNEQQRFKKLKDAERNLEINKRNNLEKLRQKKYLEKCINLYGEKNGNLIAKNEIEIGMNKEMCLLSWGKPFDIYTVKTENKIREILHYSYQKSLYFENNILVKIEY